jgi:dTDP-4-amino-4,6-dideoxygalactose transaminase
VIEPRLRRVSAVSDREPRIPFQRPSLPPSAAVERYFAESRAERWFSNGGPCWKRLRARLEERTGVACVPVANATVGLLAAITAVRRHAPSSARAVALPSFTFAATIQAACLGGLDPVFVDIDADHWHLDPVQLEAALERDDLALVIACSAFGTPPPPQVRQRWEDACASRGVPLVIDSAAGFGATAPDGVPIGAQGTVEIVSFHATKPFAIGEGGAVFTRDVALAARLERTVNFGLDESRRVAVSPAINGKMSEIHAAIGLAVLDDFDTIIERRREAASQLRTALEPGFAFQDGCDASTWQFVPVAVPGDRESIIRAARDRIELRTYYEPLHLMPAFREVPRVGSLDATSSLGERILSLPMANDLRADEIAAIVAAMAGD